MNPNTINQLVDPNAAGVFVQSAPAIAPIVMAGMRFAGRAVRGRGDSNSGNYSSPDQTMVEYRKRPLWRAVAAKTALLSTLTGSWFVASGVKAGVAELAQTGTVVTEASVLSGEIVDVMPSLMECIGSQEVNVVTWAEASKTIPMFPDPKVENRYEAPIVVQFCYKDTNIKRVTNTSPEPGEPVVTLTFDSKNVQALVYPKNAIDPTAHNTLDNFIAHKISDGEWKWEWIKSFFKERDGKPSENSYQALRSYVQDISELTAMEFAVEKCGPKGLNLLWDQAKYDLQAQAAREYNQYNPDEDPLKPQQVVVERIGAEKGDPQGIGVELSSQYEEEQKRLAGMVTGAEKNDFNIGKGIVYEKDRADPECTVSPELASRSQQGGN